MMLRKLDGTFPVTSTLWVLNNLTGKLTIISSVLLFYWSIPVSPPVEFETGLKIDEMS